MRLFANYTGPQTREHQLAQLALKAPYTDAAYGLADGGFDFISTVPQAADIPTYTQFTPLDRAASLFERVDRVDAGIDAGGTVTFRRRAMCRWRMMRRARTPRLRRHQEALRRR